MSKERVYVKVSSDFDSTGYMATGWIQWNGKYYSCRPVDGDRLVDTVVPDGSGRRVDSTGAWIQ